MNQFAIIKYSKSNVFLGQVIYYFRDSPRFPCTFKIIRALSDTADLAHYKKANGEYHTSPRSDCIFWLNSFKLL